MLVHGAFVAKKGRKQCTNRTRGIHLKLGTMQWIGMCLQKIWGAQEKPKEVCGRVRVKGHLWRTSLLEGLAWMDRSHAAGYINRGRVTEW